MSTTENKDAIHFSESTARELKQLRQDSSEGTPQAAHSVLPPFRNSSWGNLGDFVQSCPPFPRVFSQQSASYRANARVRMSLCITKLIPVTQFTKYNNESHYKRNSSVVVRMVCMILLLAR